MALDSSPMRHLNRLLYCLAAAWMGCQGGLSHALFASAPAGGEAAPHVTLPLDDYLEMKKRLDSPSVTTLEEVVLSGDMKSDSGVTVTFRGSASGLRPAREVLEQNESFSLSSCEGSAILSTHGNQISLIPQKERFQLTCRLLARQKAEITLALLGALSVRSTVQGAELIVRSVSAERREFVLARSDGSKAVVAGGPVSASGRYRVSVYPDDVKFEYSLTFYNPNRTSQPFALDLKNGETVQEVRTEIPYEESGRQLRLKVTPGESSFFLRGTLKAGAFQPPLASSQQYLLLENHPLLHVTSQAKARRISPSESGMNPRFAGAVAFLLRPEDRLTWESQKLAVLETQGYTIDGANYVYYVPQQGEGIVEAHFSIENRGVPEITLPVPGKATYLEINSVPQALYKDDRGNLLIHLPAGRPQLLVQYRPTDDVGSMIGSIRDRLLRPDGVISDLSVRVLIPQGWQLLYGGMVSDFRTIFRDAPWARALALFFLFALFFRRLGLRKSHQLLGGAGPALLVLHQPVWFELLSAAWVLGWLYRVRQPILGWISVSRVRKAGAFLAATAATLVLLVHFVDRRESEQAASDFLSGAPAASPPIRSAPMAGAIRRMGRARMARKEKLEASADALSDEGGGTGALAEAEEPQPQEAPAAEPELSTESGFQGIPARIKIPRGGRSFEFSRALVERDSPVTVWVGVVSARLWFAIPAALVLLALWIAASNRSLIFRFLHATEGS